MRTFIGNEDAVNTVIGHILSLVVLMIFTGSITAAFYDYVDSSSKQSMRTSSADLGSQIARDITNMYKTSESSRNDIFLNVTRSIPLTMGGRGYTIEMANSSVPGGMRSIDIKDGSFFGFPVSTTLNSVDTNVNTGLSKKVMSGSGTLNIKMKKTNGTRELWIE